jgi:hypothetical protein
VCQPRLATLQNPFCGKRIYVAPNRTLEDFENTFEWNRWFIGVVGLSYACQLFQSI